MTSVLAAASRPRSDTQSPKVPISLSQQVTTAVAPINLSGPLAPLPNVANITATPNATSNKRKDKIFLFIHFVSNFEYFFCVIIV